LYKYVRQYVKRIVYVDIDYNWVEIQNNSLTIKVHCIRSSKIAFLDFILVVVVVVVTAVVVVVVVVVVTAGIVVLIK